MTIIKHIIGSRQEQLLNTVFDKQGLAKDSQHGEYRPTNRNVVFDDCDEAICDDGDVNLYSDSILRLAPKGVDLKMLLNPFEEEFHLPTVAVKQCDVFSCEIEVVGIVYERPSKVWCVVDNSSEFGRIVFSIPLSCKADCLVEQDVVFSVDSLIPTDNFVFRMSFLSDNEECATKVYGEKSSEIEIPTVEYVACIGFISNPFHRPGIMHIGIGDTVKHRYFGDNVNLSVDLDSRLGATKMGPSEDGHTEIDCCGVHRIKPSVKLKFLCDSPLLGKRHHVECILLENPRVAEYVSLRECVSNNSCRPKSKIVRPFSMSSSNIREFPETPATHKLSKHQNKQMIPMTEAPSLRPVWIPCNDSPELSLRQEHRDLCKNVVSYMHNWSEFYSVPNIRISNVGHKFYKTNLCA